MKDFVASQKYQLPLAALSSWCLVQWYWHCATWPSVGFSLAALIGLLHYSRRKGILFAIGSLA